MIVCSAYPMGTQAGVKKKELTSSTAEASTVTGLMAGSRIPRASVVNPNKQWRTT